MLHTSILGRAETVCSALNQKILATFLSTGLYGWTKHVHGGRQCQPAAQLNLHCIGPLNLISFNQCFSSCYVHFYYSCQNFHKNSKFCLHARFHFTVNSTIIHTLHELSGYSHFKNSQLGIMSGSKVNSVIISVFLYCLCVACVIQYVEFSNPAKLPTLVQCYNMALRPGPTLVAPSAHYTVHNMTHKSVHYIHTTNTWWSSSLLLRTRYTGFSWKWRSRQVATQRMRAYLLPNTILM